jgi:hypothetical protein
MLYFTPILSALRDIAFFQVFQYIIEYIATVIESHADYIQFLRGKLIHTVVLSEPLNDPGNSLSQYGVGLIFW